MVGEAATTGCTSTAPAREAVISTGSPSPFVPLALAPALSSARVIGALPLVAAMPSGVTPYRFVAFALAPFSRSNSAT